MKAEPEDRTSAPAETNLCRHCGNVIYRYTGRNEAQAGSWKHIENALAECITCEIKTTAE